MSVYNKMSNDILQSDGLEAVCTQRGRLGVGVLLLGQLKCETA